MPYTYWCSLRKKMAPLEPHIKVKLLYPRSILWRFEVLRKVETMCRPGLQLRREHLSQTTSLIHVIHKRWPVWKEAPLACALKKKGLGVTMIGLEVQRKTQSGGASRTIHQHSLQITTLQTTLRAHGRCKCGKNYLTSLWCALGEQKVTQNEASFIRENAIFLKHEWPI